MSQRFLVNVIAFAVTALPSFVAVAAVDPLLVVVETAPGAAVDAVEVRQAITGELGTPVIAPRDPAAPDMSDLLIVTVDRAEIRMWLRGRAPGVVSRAVPAPLDRRARLQSIRWLAGNLARDQVSAIVAALPAPVPVTVAPGEAEPSSSVAAAPPPRPPAVAPTTDPPPFAATVPPDTKGSSGGAVATQASPTAAVGAGSVWSLALGGGPSMLFQGDRDHRVWPGPGVWYLELQRRPWSNGRILGAVLEVGPDMALAGVRGPFDFIGAAFLVGGTHRFGRTFVEGTAGLGLEAYQFTSTVTTESTSPETGVMTVVNQSFSTVTLGLYLRGQATAGVAVSKSFELLASLGGHIGTVGRMDAFFSTSLGVRFRF